MHRIRALTLWRRVVHRAGALRPAPVALADVEGAADHLGVYVSGFLLREGGFGVDHAAGFAFVVDAKDFGVNEEGLRGAG